MRMFDWSKGLLIAGVCLPGLARGQWATDSGSTLSISSLSSEQVLAKVVPTADGGCYISWFDNSAGGYDVRLQRLDVSGVKQWGTDGILIADREFSSVQDYAVALHASGDAIVAYRDDGAVSGATAQISAQRVTPAGVKVWGANGVSLSSGLPGKNQPRLTASADGSIFVGWSFQPTGSASQVAVQKLDANGNGLWASETVLSEASRSMTLSDLKPGLSGSVIALWVRAGGTNPITSAKHLYLQNLDSTGAPAWNGGSPVIAFDSSSVQNGNFPALVSDGAGGAVIGWYETGGSRNAYIQHVLSDGTLKFAAPVASTGATPGRIRVGASAAYDAAELSYTLAWPETDEGSQSLNSVVAQKFDSTGTLVWGSTGTELVAPTTAMQPSFVGCHAVQSGAVIAWIETASFQNARLVAGRVDLAGSLVWTSELSGISGGKSRLSCAVSTQGPIVAAFQSGDAGNYDLYAQNVGIDGVLGPIVGCTSPCLGDFDCSGGVDLTDLLQFLSAWLAELGLSGPNLASDRNADNAVDLTDLLDFIGSWVSELGSCGG